jgi:competence protein ComEA
MTTRKPFRLTVHSWGARWALALSTWLFASVSAHAADAEVNTANQAELERVIGIGPDLSGRLLAERAKGAFKDWVDLQKRMAGIGPVRARKLSAAGLKVQGQGYPTTAEAAQPR